MTKMKYKKRIKELHINKMKNNTKFYKKFTTKAHLIVTFFREKKVSKNGIMTFQFTHKANQHLFLPLDLTTKQY